MAKHAVNTFDIENASSLE